SGSAQATAISESVVDETFRVDLASTSGGIVMVWRDGQAGDTYARTYDDTLTASDPAELLFEDGWLLDLHVEGMGAGYSLVQRYWHATANTYERRTYAGTKQPGEAWVNVALASVSTGSQLPKGPPTVWSASDASGTAVALGALGGAGMSTAYLDAAGVLSWGVSIYDGFQVGTAPMVALDGNGSAHCT